MAPFVCIEKTYIQVEEKALSHAVEVQFLLGQSRQSAEWSFTWCGMSCISECFQGKVGQNWKEYYFTLHGSWWLALLQVSEICNSVGGGVLFDIPPRCWCWRRWQHALRVSHLSHSLPLTLITMHMSTAAAVVNNTMFYDATRSSCWSVARPIAAVAATMASFNSA